MYREDEWIHQPKTISEYTHEREFMVLNGNSPPHKFENDKYLGLNSDRYLRVVLFLDQSAGLNFHFHLINSKISRQSEWMCETCERILYRKKKG